MATEEGIVIKIGGQNTQTAWVKTTQASACKSCSARHSCNTESKGEAREVQAVNLVGAKVGDLIQISIDTGALLKATFLLYIFPIICMLIGGLAGHRLGNHMGINPSAVSASLAILSFVSAMFMVRLKAGRMALKMEYRPKITRVIGKAAAAEALPANPEGCTIRLAGSS